jgi:hypothetical protein
MGNQRLHIRGGEWEVPFRPHQRHTLGVDICATDYLQFRVTVRLQVYVGNTTQPNDADTPLFIRHLPRLLSLAFSVVAGDGFGTVCLSMIQELLDARSSNSCCVGKSLSIRELNNEEV